jgi:hypothetical protein
MLAKPDTLADYGKRRLDAVAVLARRIDFWAATLERDLPPQLVRDLEFAAGELTTLRAILLSGMADGDGVVVIFQ